MFSCGQIPLRVWLQDDGLYVTLVRRNSMIAIGYERGKHNNNYIIAKIAEEMTADDLETTYDTVFVLWRDELFKWIGRSKARDWMDEARLFSVSFSGHFIGLCFKESLVLCNPCLAVLPRVSRTPSVDSWRDRTAEKKLRSFYVSAGSFMANDLCCWFKRHRVLWTCR